MPAKVVKKAETYTSFGFFRDQRLVISDQFVKPRFI